MPFLEKVIQPSAANTDTTIYEMPAGQNGSVHGLTAVAGATAITAVFKLFVSATGLTLPLTGSKSVAVNSEWTFPKPINLSAGDKLLVSVGAANTATIVAAIYNDLSNMPGTAFNPTGEWSSIASYNAGDVVSYQGSSYIALRASANDPPPSTNWMIQAQSITGPQGPQGIQGIQGIQGQQGIQGAWGPGCARCSFTGDVAATVGVARWYPDHNITLANVYFSVGTALTAGSLGIDVLKNGVSIFGGGDKPTLLAGAFKSSVIANNTTLTPDDYLTVSVIGTGTGAQFLTALTTYN